VEEVDVEVMEEEEVAPEDSVEGAVDHLLLALRLRPQPQRPPLLPLRDHRRSRANSMAQDILCGPRLAACRRCMGGGGGFERPNPGVMG
jgi:hypothetical protein